VAMQPLVENGLAAALASPLKAPGFLRCQLDIRDFKMGGVSAARPDVDLRAAPPVRNYRSQAWSRIG